MKNLTIGIDLGGTTITAGLVDGEGRILAQKTCPTALPRPASEVERTMAEMCAELVKQAGLKLDELEGVGIGTPGSVDGESGIVAFNPNFGYERWALAAAMERRLGCAYPVRIENDANAAAYGEYCAGAAKGHNSAVVITLGTGIGGGIILNGKIWSGFNGAGAEVGHTVIVKDGEPCTCGRRGCWERYASSRALVARGARAMADHPESSLWQLAGSPEKLNAKKIFDALHGGDALARELFEEWIGYVSCGVINLVNIFQPEVICIGGGVSRQGEVLLEPIRQALERENFARNLFRHTQVRSCVLYNEAGLIGAAYLARAR